MLFLFEFSYSIHTFLEKKTCQVNKTSTSDFIAYQGLCWLQIYLESQI